MKNARQHIPEPTLVPPPVPVTAVAQQAQQTIAAAKAPSPPPAVPIAAEPRMKVTPLGMELAYPHIVLKSSIFVSKAHAINTDKINPKRAVIAGSVLVIDELGLILPIAGVLLIRTGEPIPTSATV